MRMNSTNDMSVWSRLARFASPRLPETPQEPARGKQTAADRNALLDQIEKAPNVTAALVPVLALVTDPGFAARLPAGQPFVLARHKTQRPFSEAALEWTKAGDLAAHTLLCGERTLSIVQEKGETHVDFTFRDVMVRYDRKTRQLVSHRTEGHRPATPKQTSDIAAAFPNLTVKELASRLRKSDAVLPPGDSAK